MQNVTNFINLLGENYYLDFIIQPYSEEVDYEKHFVLVHYQDKKYYEQTHEFIQIRQNEIINDAKSLFQKSISDIYLEVSKMKNEDIEKFLNFNIQATKVKLNILKNDFYVENDKSRYCAILYDDADTQTLETFFSKRDYSSTTTNIEIKSIIQKLNSDDNAKNLLTFNTSDYFLEFHNQRFKLLSFLPFKLFHIGHRFVFELEKIKELSPVSKLKKAKLKVEQLQSVSIMNKKDTYFDKFCEIIDDINILEKSTSIGVLIDLNLCIKEIKSETLKELQTTTTNRNDFLDLKINEVEKCSYHKNADTQYIQKWLDQYNITIEEILNNSWRNNPIAKVIDQHYKDLEKFSKEQNDAYNLQLDFYYYFCKICADELIVFFNSKKSDKLSPESKPQPSQKPYKDVILEGFLNEINNIDDLYKYTFIQCYDFGIKRFTDSLILEIKENILLLPQEKINIYLEYIQDKIESSPNYCTNEISLDKWITEYKLENLNFPYLENKDVNGLITKSITYHLWDEKDRSLMENIQLDFFYYAVKLESDKVINYIKNLNPSNADKKTNTKENLGFDSIFKSIEAFHKFNELVEYLNIDTSNISLRGNQAKFSSIWSCTQSNKELFKELTELNKYIAFLNKTYKANYKSRTFSDGTKYFVSIKNWLKESN
jgi:hypothetical protein